VAICRLIYRSQAIEDIDGDLLADIEESSARNNSEEDVTGILVASKRAFLQVLEGDRANLSRVFRRIARDERHEEIELVSFDEVSERDFQDWNMKGVGVGLMGRILGHKLKQKYGEKDGDLDLPTDKHRAFALLHDVAFHLRGGEL